MAAEVLGGAVVAVLAVVWLQRWYDARRRRERLNHLCGFVAQDLLRIAEWIFVFEQRIEPIRARDVPTGDYAHLLRTVEAREALPPHLLHAALDMYESARRLQRRLGQSFAVYGFVDRWVEDLKAAVARAELELRPIAPIATDEGIEGKTIWEWDDIDLFERPMRDDPWSERGLTRPGSTKR